MIVLVADGQTSAAACADCAAGKYAGSDGPDVLTEMVGVILLKSIKERAEGPIYRRDTSERVTHSLRNQNAQAQYSIDRSNPCLL